MRCSLYRHFDDHGVLLYVGIANAPHARGADHASTSAWVEYARGGSIEWFDTREEAESAELRAIRLESPVFNRLGSIGDPEARVEAYLVGRDATAAALRARARRESTRERLRATGESLNLVSLAEYSGMVGDGLTVKTLRNGRDRDPSFPEPAGTGPRNASLYDPADLKAWAAARARESR